jgi:hypothetical protein
MDMHSGFLGMSALQPSRARLEPSVIDAINKRNLLRDGSTATLGLNQYSPNVYVLLARPLASLTFKTGETSNAVEKPL